MPYLRHPTDDATLEFGNRDRLRPGFDEDDVLFNRAAGEGDAFAIRRPGKTVNFGFAKMSELLGWAVIERENPEIGDAAAVIERVCQLF